MNRYELCRCGCGESVAHRRWGTIWAHEGCRKAYQRGRAPANAPKTRTRRPSGYQVAFWRAVDAHATDLIQYMVTPERARERAFDAQVRALSARQRQRLGLQLGRPLEGSL